MNMGIGRKTKLGNTALPRYHMLKSLNETETLSFLNVFGVFEGNSPIFLYE